MSARGALWAACAAVTVHALATGLRGPAPDVVLPADAPATDVVIQFHRPGHERFLPVFGQILGALDPAATVRVVVSDDEDVALFEAARATWGVGPVDYVVVGHPISSWARDRMVVAGDTLLAPSTAMPGAEARAMDWLVPWDLAEHLGRPVRRTSWIFEGGDLIADAERVYVAAPLLERNPYVDTPTLVARIEADMGLPVVVLGDEGAAVPDHHVGMFVTPLGGGRVAVADPDLAVAILGDELPVDVDEDAFEAFRQVARELRAEGLEVVPMPVLPTSKKWAWLSYDNVLLDRRADGLHVLMPTYGVPALDDAAAAIWAEQGAVVHRIDVTGVYELGGSVRCLTHTLG